MLGRVIAHAQRNAVDERLCTFSAVDAWLSGLESHAEPGRVHKPSACAFTVSVLAALSPGHGAAPVVASSGLRHKRATRLQR